jgi:hypothetical protein
MTGENKRQTNDKGEKLGWVELVEVVALELAAVHVGDIAEYGGRCAQEAARGLIGLGTAGGASLGPSRMLEQALLHAGLLPQLLQPQLVLPLPLGPATERQ